MVSKVDPAGTARYAFGGDSWQLLPCFPDLLGAVMFRHRFVRGCRAKTIEMVSGLMNLVMVLDVDFLRHLFRRAHGAIQP
jgi:hypothetical protein